MDLVAQGSGVHGQPCWCTGSAHNRLAHDLPGRVVWEQTGQWLSATG
ncbi:hypothetical protein [Streptomyces griseoaurantiacus]